MTDPIDTEPLPADPVEPPAEPLPDEVPTGDPEAPEEPA